MALHIVGITAFQQIKLQRLHTDHSNIMILLIMGPSLQRSTIDVRANLHLVGYSTITPLPVLEK